MFSTFVKGNIQPVTVAGSKGHDDVVGCHLFRDQTQRIWRDAAVAADRIRGRERGEDARVAAIEITEVMQLAIR